MTDEITSPVATCTHGASVYQALARNSVCSVTYGIIRIDSDRFTNLLCRPQVLLKPIQRFLDEIVARKIVTGVIKEMSFLVVARSKQMKEGFLRRFDRIHEIVAAIQHQHRLLDSRKEIHGVDFGKWAYKIQPAQREDADPDPRLDG